MNASSSVAVGCRNYIHVACLSLRVEYRPTISSPCELKQTFRRSFPTCSSPRKSVLSSRMCLCDNQATKNCVVCTSGSEYEYRLPAGIAPKRLNVITSSSLRTKRHNWRIPPRSVTALTNSQSAAVQCLENGARQRHSYYWNSHVISRTSWF